MTDVLVKKHESLATAQEIMDALKAMFGQPEWSLIHEAIKYISTKHMKEGTSVREHVLDMMMHVNIVEVNGGAIDEANQEIVLGKGFEITLKVGTEEMVSAKPVGLIFTLNRGAVIWRSVKQSCIADSTMEAEYVAACEAAKEAV
ncbi:gag/pol protein [Cucumis melo var. makuwa]|uniref:Gag/pol protein n=1 Tax=Cucumis melo var. makuwa TaxID=1194695 RepID=A0A5A7V609_CUCMM|nr:gag/pol protein [Cucumis melo var. makuwa]TYK24003.1 gag/pol protein [Cucumis melo var. makuwa]